MGKSDKYTLRRIIKDTLNGKLSKGELDAYRYVKRLSEEDARKLLLKMLIVLINITATFQNQFKKYLEETMDEDGRRE